MAIIRAGTGPTRFAADRRGLLFGITTVRQGDSRPDACQIRDTADRVMPVPVGTGEPDRPASRGRRCAPFAGVKEQVGD